MLTTVMYHYVRPRPGPGEVRLHIRTLEEFEGQLEYIGRRYRVVSPAEVLAAMQGDHPLPPEACLLTFDDGLRDHLTHVMPRLADRGWSGLFFVTTAPVLERRALDVHKIHFILAASPAPERLSDELLARLAPFRAAHSIPSDEELLARFGSPNRFDSPSVTFFKRLLQRGLPEPVRSAIVADLFHRLVTTDERAFVEQLYLDRADLTVMESAGMMIGGHGSTHSWMSTLSPEALQEEIVASAALVTSVHRGPWAMSYPYGESVPGAEVPLREAGCVVAFTASPVREDSAFPYRLPRHDTNDLPLTAPERRRRPPHRATSAAGPLRS